MNLAFLPIKILANFSLLLSIETMALIINTVILLALVFANGGRHDWVYQWGAGLLALNALPFLYRLIRQRGRLLGRGPIFWLPGVLLPWCAFGALFYVALNNPSHELLSPYNLFSPLHPLAYDTALPSTPNPERSRLFLLFLLGLLCLPLNLLTAPVRRKQLRRCLGVIVVVAGGLAIIGAVMKLTGNPLLFGWIEQREPIAFGSFFYKNHWAYFALLASGCGMGLYHSVFNQERHSGHFPEKSLGIGLLVLVLLVSIPLAEARGATLAALPLALAFIISLCPSRWKQRPALRLGLILLITLCAGTLIHRMVAPQMERSFKRSEQQIEAFEKDDLRRIKRLALYRDSWQMIQDKTLWGWGIGSFIHIHPIYAGPEFYNKDPDYPVAYEFTHSDPLQSLVEFGIAGCLLLFTPFFILVLGLKHAFAPNRLSLWLLSACGAVLLASSVDMVFTAPAIAFGVLLCASAAMRYGIETKQLKR